MASERLCIFVHVWKIVSSTINRNVEKREEYLFYSIGGHFYVANVNQIIWWVFHQHNHCFYSADKEKHIHEFHKKCAIPGLELSFFEAEEQALIAKKQYYFIAITDKYKSVFVNINSKFSFLLRAPPFDIDLLLPL